MRRMKWPRRKKSERRVSRRSTRCRVELMVRGNDVDVIVGMDLNGHHPLWSAKQARGKEEANRAQSIWAWAGAAAIDIVNRPHLVTRKSSGSSPDQFGCSASM